METFYFVFLCISTSSYRSGVWKRKFRAAYDSQENLNEICSLLLQNSGQFWPTTAGRCFACIAFVLAKGGKEETHDEFHGISLAIIDLYKYFCDSKWHLFVKKKNPTDSLVFPHAAHKRHWWFLRWFHLRLNFRFCKRKLSSGLQEKKCHEQQFESSNFLLSVVKQLREKCHCGLKKFLRSVLAFLQTQLSSNSESSKALKVWCAPLSIPL